MISRRDFLSTAGASLALPSLPAGGQPPPGRRKRLAILTTEWRYRSHAWHMGERFLVGYPVRGKWHPPALDVVAAYVDQSPKNDLSRQRALSSGRTSWAKSTRSSVRVARGRVRAGTRRMAAERCLTLFARPAPLLRKLSGRSLPQTPASCPRTAK
jgi:hypothetical protein